MFYIFIDVYNEMVKFGYKWDMFMYFVVLILFIGKFEMIN